MLNGKPKTLTAGNAAATGRAGEQAAAEHLRRAGYELLDLNWRSGRYEIDIVARRDGRIHIVEVKTRRAAGLTAPEEALTPAKCRALRHAALHYLAHHGFEDEEFQFDLASVDVLPDGGLEVRLTEDAVEFHW